MRPSRRILGLGSALVLSAACSTHRGPSIPLLFGDKADPMTGCAVSSGTDDRVSGVNRIRVTLRSRSDDGSTRDFCDTLFNFPGTPPYLRLEANGTDKVDIYVEAFATTSGGDAGAGGVTRVATGTLPGVSPSEASLGTMRLYPTEDFRCAPNQAQFGRAFHTATLLPDGRVLFIGGLVANVMDPTDKTFPATGATATDQAEIWDPRTQALTLVNDATAVGDMGTTPDLASGGDMAGSTDGGTPTIVYRPGRAFHNAVLLSTNGPCAANDFAVLVVGGFSPVTANGPMFAGEVGLPGSRLQPFAGNNLLPLHAASNEVFCLDPTTNKATHVPITGTPLGFRASAVGPTGFVIAGGNDFDSGNDTTFPAGDLNVFPLGGGTVLSGDTASHRLGATLTVLPDGQALMWGGGEYTDPPGELLGDLNAAPYGAGLAVSSVTPTQFQTATLLSGTPTPSVLVTGGFEVVSTALDTQPPIAGNAVRVLSVVDGNVTPSTPPFGTNPTSGVGYSSVVTSCLDPMRYRPAGYESAVALDRGRVLVTGGAPSTESITSHCPDCPGDNLTLCALGQASLYEAGQIVPAAAMQVPRFGHTSTVLPDGTILIAGGIGQRGSMTQFINDLEVYNPRTTTPPAGTDTDDPIADLLAADKLTRAPAEQAVDPAKPTKPAKSCGTL